MPCQYTQSQKKNINKNLKIGYNFLGWPEIYYDWSAWRFCMIAKIEFEDFQQQIMHMNLTSDYSETCSVDFVNILL